MKLPRERLRITIVDDDPTVPPVVTRVLCHEFGTRVSIKSFDDVDAARESLQTGGCDLLISDIEMPNLDGLALFEIAKTANAWTQVVYMTAHTTWGRLLKARAQGDSNYLLKPVSREELIHVVTAEHERFQRWQQALVDTVVAPFC